ncbi:hypothetical protein [Roseomonas sp. KE2513]|uniref:hypothetical protein n=1 Tax=Roseomonas sp. KE2513 TaxID=2479202 RepID=UPI0018E00F49|nr:hypothetical protein [Roseomonas sp. KE2513]
MTTLGEAVPYEKQYLRKNGSRWWGLFTPRRVGVEVVEFVLDVTSRKKAEQAVRGSEECFWALVAATAATVWTTDAEGLAREDSASWRTFTGQTFEEWLGTIWADVVHPDDRSRVVDGWAGTVTGGTAKGAPAWRMLDDAPPSPPRPPTTRRLSRPPRLRASCCTPACWAMCGYPGSSEQAPQRNQAIERTTPPSTRSAVPLVAEACCEQT